MKIVLASSSPRRKEMLTRLGLSFQSIDPNIPENQLPDESANAFVQRLASDKARAALQIYNHTELVQDLCVIAGDTAVVLNDQILGQPIDTAHARRMLKQLSNRRHTVMTGVCLMRQTHGTIDFEKTFAVSTTVLFKLLSASEIDAYIQTGDPLDKAGSYGIQSGAAYMIREIHGSYTNVVGLPLTELVEELEMLGIR